MAGRADPLGLSPRALYFLLSYAAELYDPRDELFSGEYDAVIPAELLFRALADAAVGLIRRGADRVYVEESSFGPSIRGRIDMGRTIARDLGIGARAVSVAARLSPSCPQNDAIKTALCLSEAMPGLSADTRERARALGRAFPGDELRTIVEGRSALRQARLHRNNGGYRKALFWSRLILNSSRATEGSIGIEDPFDRNFMNRAFEAFVRRGLAAKIDDGSRVMRNRFHWNPIKGMRSPIEPVMETDVTVLGRHYCMVVDAKYYYAPLIEHPRGGRKLRSAHLYQIASYLRTLRRRDSLGRSWSACLVYARKDESFDYRIDLGDLKLRILGLDIETEPKALLEAIGSVWQH
jgi:5-methylcytosine-specific restriction enzyme subunit McrC